MKEFKSELSFLTPIEKYVIDNDLDNNGNSIAGSIHAGFTASLLCNNHAEAKRFIDAQSVLFHRIAVEMRKELGSDEENVAYGFEKEIFMETAEKVYNFCMFLLSSNDTELSKIIIDNRERLLGENNAR